MSIYKIWREGPKEQLGEVHCTNDGMAVPHISVHSPTGFEFGYWGSGPADLALAILVHYLGASTDPADYKRGLMDPPGRPVRLAIRYHQEFKQDFIGNQQGGEFEIQSEEIAIWIEARNFAPVIAGF